MATRLALANIKLGADAQNRRRNLDELAGQLGEVNADVWVLAEVLHPHDEDTSQATELAARLNKHSPEHPYQVRELIMGQSARPWGEPKRDGSDDDGPRDDVKLAILSRLPFVGEATTIPLRRPAFETVNKRQIMSTTVQTEDGPLGIDLTNLSWVPGLKVGQARTLFRGARERHERDRIPMVVMGDMNSPRRAPWSWFARRGFKHAVKGRTFPNGGIYLAFNNERAGFMLPTGGPIAQLDQILHTDDLVAGDSGVHEVGSDHRAVWADVRPHSGVRR